MPNLYNTTAMLISGNLKEGKNGDGCFFLQLSNIDIQPSPWSILIPKQTTEQIHVIHFLIIRRFSVFSHLQWWDLKWYEKRVEYLPTSVALVFQYHGTTFFF